MSWRKCSSCRKEIEFNQVYWVCSVSTCQRKRTALYFCSVPCWEMHLPTMRHREAWAEERKGPSRAEWERQLAADKEAEKEAEQKARSVSTPPASTEPRLRRTISPTKNESGEELPRDILIVVSKLKKYVKARAGMKTSETVMPALSDHLRKICDRAIRIADEEGRKTVLDRDIRDALK